MNKKFHSDEAKHAYKEGIKRGISDSIDIVEGTLNFYDKKIWGLVLLM